MGCGRAPGEVDVVGPAPAILGPGLGRLGCDPAEVDELAACLLDASDVDAEGARDPGGLDASAWPEPPPAPRQASQEDAERGGDECGSGAVDQEPEDASRDDEGSP